MFDGHLLNESEAAQYLGCTASLMRKWRQRGGGPGYCHIGRLVRYPEADLMAFIEGNRVQTTVAQQATGENTL